MSDKTTTAYWHGGAPGLKPGDNRKLHERRRLWRAWTKALLPGWHQSRGAMIELRLAEDLLMRHMLIDHDGAVVA